MFDFEICTMANGWIFADVTEGHIEVAKERYLERQRRCAAKGERKAHFTPDSLDAGDVDTKNDHRWSGDLGEMLVKDYLEQRAYDHHWLADVKESEYDPDFLINRIKIDVKTKRYKHAPKMIDTYFQTVNHDQFVLAKTRGIQGFIFCDYAYMDRQVYLAGKISYAQFDQIKIERNVGDRVHKHFTVQAKSWDVPVTALTPPMRWQKASR